MAVSRIGIAEILKTQIIKKIKKNFRFFYFIFLFSSNIVFSLFYFLTFRFSILYIGSLWLKLATKSLKYYMPNNFAIMQKTRLSN